MLERLRHCIGAVVPGLHRLRWGAGAPVCFGILCWCVISSLRSPAQYAASAVLKIEFVGAGTNAASLSPECYATNRVGWGPLNTEARFLGSELLVRRALQRLDAGPEPRKVRRDGVPA
jgi:hypothetical protein